MTPAGYLFMAASWAAIIGLNVFCFWRLGRSEADDEGRRDRTR